MMKVSVVIICISQFYYVMIIQLNSTEIILYVENQGISCAFYQALLGFAPILDVPGMTEFELGPYCKLGLMPNAGIAKILADKMPHPAEANGIPRCELYLQVNDIESACTHALKTGAKLIADLAHRDWGDQVCYMADPDGHIIAFATPTSKQLK